MSRDGQAISATEGWCHRIRGTPAKIRPVIQVIMGSSIDAALFFSTAMLPSKLKWPGHLRNLRPIAPR